MKKRSKGFTLVEILGVVTILGILALLIVPTVSTLLAKNEAKLYTIQIDSIKTGLKEFGDGNTDILPSDGNSVQLSLGLLKVMGFVTSDIKNPKTNACFSNDMVVTITSIKNGYTYSVDEESGSTSTSSDCQAPSTNFLLLKGNAKINVQINTSYVDAGYAAFDSSGNIVKTGITKTITDKNGSVVSSINTSSTSGSPYKITYQYGTLTVARTITIADGDPIGTVYSFNYIGSVQNLSLKTGTYKLEVWGAAGGYRSTASKAGLGGYSTGELTLSSTTSLYIYVGGSGASGGFNGGGTRPTYLGGGGGTDIRIGIDSLYARVIVAGGGGSDGSTSNAGGAGGGTIGISRTESFTGDAQYSGNGGTQIAAGGAGSSYGIAGSFGIGGNGIYANNGYGGAGGGGWYGGSGTYPDSSCDDDRGGGGGSGWVYTAISFTTWQSGNTSDAAKWLLNSNYYLANSSTIDGASSMPTIDGTATMTGNNTNGYVKITKLS